MDQETLLHMLTPFPEDGEESALIDRAKLKLWIPVEHHTKLQPRPGIRNVSSTRELGLDCDCQVRYFHRGPNGPSLAWKTEHGTVRQNLGARPDYGRTMRSISQTIELNGCRMAQQRLTSKERRRHAVPLSRKDNFVHPRAVAAAELQRRIADCIAEVLRAARDNYIRLVAHVYGKIVPANQVRVSPAEIEVAWDVVCEPQLLLLRAFEEPWKRQLHDARRQHVCAGRIDREDQCLCHRSSKGYLAATLGKAYRLKLYPLPESAVRFECTLSGAAVKNAGVSYWNLFDQADLRQGLQRCARHVYPFIRNVQSEVDLRHDVNNVLDLPTLFCPGARGRAVREILRQLCDSGRVHASDESIRRLLRGYAKAGIMQNAGRGYWRLTRSYAKPFKVLRRLMELIVP